MPVPWSRTVIPSNGSDSKSNSSDGSIIIDTNKSTTGSARDRATNSGDYDVILIMNRNGYRRDAAPPARGSYGVAVGIQGRGAESQLLEELYHSVCEATE